LWWCVLKKTEGRVKCSFVKGWVLAAVVAAVLRGSHLLPANPASSRN